MMVILCIVDANRTKVLSSEELVRLEYADDTYLNMRNAQDVKLKWTAVGLPGYVRCIFIQDNNRTAHIKLTNQFVPTIVGRSTNIKKGAFFLSRGINHG